MKAKMKLKNLLSFLLALVMVVTLLPGMGMTALAVEDGSTDPPAPAVTEVRETPETPETPEEPETPEPDPGVTATGKMTVSQPAMMAGGSDSFGTVRLTFTEDSVFSDQVIKLKGYQYIKECKVGATVYDVPELETQDFKTNGEYVAYMYGNNLYLKGNLNGACIDLQSLCRMIRP